MFSSIIFKSGMFQNRDGGARRVIARDLNRTARRRRKAHARPDAALMRDRDMNRAIDARLDALREGRL